MVTLRSVLLVASVLGALGTTTVEEKFQQFEAFFGKNFAADERTARKAAFAENLNRIDHLNLWDDGDAIYSHLTPFADISAEEFASHFFGYKHDGSTNSELEKDTVDVSGLPADFDWRPKGAVNPVQNQGQCGSCWAFSTVCNFEGTLFVTTGSLVKLSEQQLVSCSTSSHGCNGGLPSLAFDEMKKHKSGLELETSYPYTSGGGDDGICSAPGPEVAFIAAWKSVSIFESDMASALVQYGPLSIALNAEPLQTYSSGIMDLSFFACLPQLDHAVAIVGYGEADKQYWIVRNSWSAQWGEQGYVRMRRGTGMCGLNLKVVTATSVSLKESTIVV